MAREEEEIDLAHATHHPPPASSGREPQRVNFARGLVRAYPLLLLGEPTALLGTADRATVVEPAGAAVPGVRCNRSGCDAVGDGLIDTERLRAAA